MSAILKVRSVTQNGSHFFPDIHKFNAERVVFTNLKDGGTLSGPLTISLRNIEEGRQVFNYVILDWNTAHEDEDVRDANGGEHGIPTGEKAGDLPKAGVREGANPVTHGWFFELRDKDGNIETVLTNTAAWLMSDSGKTLDRFYRE